MSSVFFIIWPAKVDNDAKATLSVSLKESPFEGADDATELMATESGGDINNDFTLAVTLSKGAIWIECAWE